MTNPALTGACEVEIHYAKLDGTRSMVINRYPDPDAAFAAGYEAAADLEAVSVRVRTTNGSNVVTTLKSPEFSWTA